MDTRYYFDNNATTPLRPEVLDAMLPYLKEQYGNASSMHHQGREARKALDASRVTVAKLLGAGERDVYFTGCGTESDNLAVTGVMRAATGGRNGFVTTAIEHHAVLNQAKRLEREGYPVTIVGVDTHGRVDLDQLGEAVNERTALVSVMHANNETGVIQDIGAAAEIAHDAGALFHTDAVQSAGKLPLDVGRMGIDLLSLSGHKINGPKGVGVLYRRRKVNLQPLTVGGGHEGKLRPGTENIPGIVGLAKALELITAERDESTTRLAALRDRLQNGILAAIDNVVVNGGGAPRLPGTLNIAVRAIEGEGMLFSLDRQGISASTGSACTALDTGASHVLLAMGLDHAAANGSLRFSMGWGTTDEAVDHVLDVFPPIVERLRSISAGMHIA